MKTLIVLTTLLSVALQPAFSKTLDFSPNHSVVLCGPTNVYFVCQSSQTVHNIWWDFGDGFTDVGNNPVHQYTEPGVYDVKMVVELNGVKDSVIKTAFVTLHTLPVVSFSYTKEQLQTLYNRTFTYTGATPNDSIAAYRWKVDGTLISLTRKCKFTFPANGLYLVSLEVTNLSGCTKVLDSAIEINDSPIPQTALFEPENKPYQCALSPDGSKLMIGRSQNLSEVLTIRLFDITGKLLNQYTLAASSNQLYIDLNNEVPTLLVVELSSQSFESVLKIDPRYL